MVSGENPFTCEVEDKMPVGRKIALMLVAKAAVDKDVWAAFRIMEQLDGKPAKTLNVGGQGGLLPVFRTLS